MRKTWFLAFQKGESAPQAIFFACSANKPQKTIDFEARRRRKKMRIWSPEYEPPRGVGGWGPDLSGSGAYHRFVNGM